MEPDVTIRDGRHDEAEAIEELWDAAYDVTTRKGTQDISKLLAHGPSVRLLVAEVDGTLAGTLIAAFDGWRGNMYRLAVHPSFQRRGVAGRLVEAAHDWLRSIGCARITALVEADHEYATSFWESAGYEHDRTMRRYHLDIGKREL
jgi:ribosomal protein S18 acetylase RimI-like enzyme